MWAQETSYKGKRRALGAQEKERQRESTWGKLREEVESELGHKEGKLTEKE